MSATLPNLLLAESCTTTWAFDTDRHRFARVPRGVPLTTGSIEWRPYADVRVDRGGGRLEVSLDGAGTNLLRSEIHAGGPCPNCGALPPATA